MFSVTDLVHGRITSSFPKQNQTSVYARLRYSLFAACIAFSTQAQATILESNEPTANAYFGGSSSLSGNDALVGAYGIQIDGKTNVGAAYYFRNLNFDTNNSVSESLILTTNSTDQIAGALFGLSTSLSGDNALVGARGLTVNGKSSAGAAYYYKDLNSATSSTVSESVKLMANTADQTGNANFGSSISLSGDKALVGAQGIKPMTGDEIIAGAAYYYKDLNNKSGVVTENVKLTATGSDPNRTASFGKSASLSGDNALVGAEGLVVGGSAYVGAAYYYKNLDTKSGTVTEDVTLMANEADRTEGAYFGRTTSLFGDNALVGAYGLDVDNLSRVGAAYYYKGLNNKSGIVTEDVKLMTSEGLSPNLGLGISSSLSGDNAMVGAYAGRTVYFYQGLNDKSGTVTEDIKFTASDVPAGAPKLGFGASVSMDGNAFVIGASSGLINGVKTGKAYAGDIRTFTVLDAGATSLSTGGLSFVSQNDWVIGETTSQNQVTIGYNVAGTAAADVANITATDKEVYIGKNAGANANTLLVEGTLIANHVNVGDYGNTGNAVLFGQDSTMEVDSFNILWGNSIGFESGIEMDFTDLVARMLANGSYLSVANIEIIRTNVADYFTKTYVNGWSIFTAAVAVPEPSTYVLLLGGVILTIVCIRRKQ